MGPPGLQVATTPGGSAEAGQLKSRDFHIKSMSVSDISGTDVKKTIDFYILSLVLLSLATLVGPPSGMGPSGSARVTQWSVRPWLYVAWREARWLAPLREGKTHTGMGVTGIVLSRKCNITHRQGRTDNSWGPPGNRRLWGPRAYRWPPRQEAVQRRGS